MKASSLLLACAAALSIPGPVSAQDLFQRSGREGSSGPLTTSEYRGRDRLDLRLSADATKLVGAQEAGSSRLGVSGYLSDPR